MMKLRAWRRPEVLIDINGISGLRYIERAAGELAHSGAPGQCTRTCWPSQAAGDHFRDPCTTPSG